MRKGQFSSCLLAQSLANSRALVLRPKFCSRLSIPSFFSWGGCSDVGLSLAFPYGIAGTCWQLPRHHLYGSSQLRVSFKLSLRMPNKRGNQFVLLATHQYSGRISEVYMYVRFIKDTIITFCLQFSAKMRAY